MKSEPVLTGKRALVFGAAGTIGAAVARELAAAGAELFLSGRTKATVEAVAKQITAKGGRAQAAAIDTLDDEAVNNYVSAIVDKGAAIDVIIDSTGPLAKQYGNTKLAVDLPIEEFMVPLMTIVKSRFITARAAARQMIKQHSGVIILVTGSPARPHVPGATAIGAAFSAMENLAQNLAFEVGPSGVRVVCLRMDSRKEVEVALSSCPASIAPKAAVYVLEESGYRKVRDSQNGFTAIVQHDWVRQMTNIQHVLSTAPRRPVGQRRRRA